MSKLRGKSKKKGKIRLMVGITGMLVGWALAGWGYLVAAVHARSDARDVRDALSTKANQALALLRYQVDPNAIPCDRPNGFEIAHPNLAPIQPVAVVDDPLPNAMALRAVQMSVHAHVTYQHQIYQQQRPFNPALILDQA